MKHWIPPTPIRPRVVDTNVSVRGPRHYLPAVGASESPLLLSTTVVVDIEADDPPRQPQCYVNSRIPARP